MIGRVFIVTAVLSTPLQTKDLVKPTTDEEKHRKMLVDEAALLGTNLS